MNDKLQILINWLQEIQDGKSPSVPYNLHPLVRCLYENLGTDESITLLSQLKNMKDE